MLCQHCKKENSKQQLTFNVNGLRRDIQLCNTCSSKLRDKLKSPESFFQFDKIISEFINHKGEDDNKLSKDSKPKGYFVPPFKPTGGFQANSTQKNGLLDELADNLNRKALEGKIDPIIGRDKEIKRVIEILNRRNKNNPVLIGSPGVGKTAIAEGLALKIVEGKVPVKLLNKEIYSLSMASLVSDTGIRGEFEKKCQDLIAEVKERGNIILFIDELHTVIGTGSAMGGTTMDAGNIFKPALSRGELQVLGATTLDEYRIIEKDEALERRFQPVIVKEPSEKDTIEILKGLKHLYEDTHQVKYSDKVLEACVKLSVRYIQNRFLPDKAIDLLDEAGSRLNLQYSVSESGSIQKEILSLRQQKEKAVKEQEFEVAAEYRDKELKLIEQLKQLKDNENQHIPEVTVEDIEQIIEEQTGIPVQKLQKEEQSKMKNLDKNLSKKIIGQDIAIEKVTKAIKRSKAGLKEPNKPIGTFLFVGPTGVGKTELVKCLAEELYGNRNQMIRLDMSEYMESHSVSKITGAPPGYVGYEEAGQLTEKVRRNPYSLILLDEVEKAHPEVLNIFLQAMDDGMLKDSQGREISFRDTIIIMTSNAGVTTNRNSVGFNQSNQEKSNKQSLLENLKPYFKPEFLNRFDAIIEFNHLTKEDIVQIVNINLEKFNKLFEEKGIKLKVTQPAKLLLGELGYSKEYGARELNRVIKEEILDRATEIILEDNKVKEISVNKTNNNIVVMKSK